MIMKVLKQKKLRDVNSVSKFKPLQMLDCLADSSRLMEVTQAREKTSAELKIQTRVTNRVISAI